ncbi:malonate decarboxylase subunit alpha [Eubacteriales bacterium OttesenSCG-928-M02]|nr:malonate decarboxylase subunit alpha [Eubacteriales bacterium OttesenSCG-928-M02]
MDKVMTAEQAVALIKSGDTIWINSFLAIANPVELNTALTRRVWDGSGLRDLTVYCSAGFGDWTENNPAEGFITGGAVKKLVLGHYGSMPATSRMVMENEIEAYNLPLGVMSHMTRAAAQGKDSLRSKVGLNLFVDPRQNRPDGQTGYGMNARSKDIMVQLVKADGEECLSYHVPKVDIALIKGSSADRWGNISFEDECATVDALSIAQAAHNNGGKVIVQVSRIIDGHQRPRNVIIPNMLVDAIVVCEDQSQIANIQGKNMSISGDIHAQGQEVAIWLELLNSNMITNGRGREALHYIIGNRAYRELKPGYIANIGIGIPELVGLTAVKEGALHQYHFTVESGAMGGMPVNGFAFGATIGAETIVDMATQFDFYDGGGLDICFMGALQVDQYGNVNAHSSKGRLAGIGGFSNITQAAKRVVFCCTFTAGGLQAQVADGRLKIDREGRVKKFVEAVDAISFSSTNARENGQEVLYVTERCVFRLGEAGLVLAEIAPGVDVERDILSQLPFPVMVEKALGEMDVANNGMEGFR